jgi:hypothetical protein
VFQEDKYLQAAEGAANLVWEQGLLKKGVGLCHGIAGNAYLFLALHRVTCKEKYLYRARVFAEFICQLVKQDDRNLAALEYSLFEGSPGTILFLLDLLSPEKSRFPITEDTI